MFLVGNGVERKRAKTKRREREKRGGNWSRGESDVEVGNKE